MLSDMKIKKYITQNLLPFFAAGWLICSTFSCTNEDIPDNMAPKLTIEEVSNALRTSAVFSGSISGETDKLKDFGFEYSTSKDFPTDQTTQVSMLESGAGTSLTIQVKGLSPSTFYYYRMYATTGATTVYSEERPFNTTSMSGPQLSELVTDSIGERYARFKFYVEDYGNEVLIECGVSYKKSDAKTFIPVASEKITEDDQYTIELTDLEPDTEYDFRAYAKNAADKDASTGSIEGYGTILKQKTAALLSANIETGVIDEGDIKITSVKMTGTINSAVGSNGAIDECGFVYSKTNALPTYNSDSKFVHPKEGINVSGEKYSYIEEITDLLQDTHYYIRAYAKNTVGGEERIAYGATREITTKRLDRPMIEFTYKADNSLDYSCTATTMTVKASIQNYDANALVEKGFIWSRSQGELSIEDAKTAGTYKAVTNGENQIVATIEGLEMASSYYIRAYAIYKSGDLTETGYTNGYTQLWTEGFNLPSLEIETSSDKLTFNSAELVGKMPNPGNTNITERGFVLSTQFSEVTLENCDKAITSDAGFITTVTGLKYQTNYYVRAYAKCELGGRTEIAYSGWNSFYTPDFDRPLFGEMKNESALNSLKVTTAITPGADGTIVARGFCAISTESTSDPTVDDLKVEEAVTPASESSYTLEIKDLSFNASYKVRAYAIVQIGDEKIVCYNGTHWMNTQNLSISTSNTPTDTKCEVQATVHSEVDLSNAEYGFVWSDNSETGPEEATGKLKCTNIDAERKFSGTIEGLTGGKTYNLWVYVTIDGKDSYIGRWEFTTKRIPGQGDNVSPDQK
jgi:hypothetical protein